MAQLGIPLARPLGARRARHQDGDHADHAQGEPQCQADIMRTAPDGAVDGLWSDNSSNPGSRPVHSHPQDNPRGWKAIDSRALPT